MLCALEGQSLPHPWCPNRGLQALLTELFSCTRFSLSLLWNWVRLVALLPGTGLKKPHALCFLQAQVSRLFLLFATQVHGQQALRRPASVNFTGELPSEAMFFASQTDMVCPSLPPHSHPSPSRISQELCEV